MERRKQKLPSAGPERESLRKKGQFWTPDWVAEAMVAYAITGGSDHLFDPAVGAGAFFRAAKSITAETHERLTLLGTELDADILGQAKENGLSEHDLSGVQITDFIGHPPQRLFKAIVANPPYIRHHRLSSEVKRDLKRLSREIIGQSLDGRAGLHIYFLLRSLKLLDTDGRLAFIMPADTCEGIFSPTLWRWITDNYCLDAVITFTPEATPFPGVDTNAIVFFIKNSKPAKQFHWLRCSAADTDHLKVWTHTEFKVIGTSLTHYQRSISEGLATGFSRAPVESESKDFVLGDFATVMRGIATGANEFFFLTTRQATELEIPVKFLLPAIGRTRDVIADTVDTATIKALENAGRPTLLLSPDGRPMKAFPPALGRYLRYGEQIGIHKRTLIATRQPWYKMESRVTPPLLFAYLGRRSSRFIRNLAGVVPLTGFLCVYPRPGVEDSVDKLWAILQHPETIKNLSLVGKSYGGGAIKVEPRGLEKLRLPLHIVLESGMAHSLTHVIQGKGNQMLQGRLF